MPSPASKFSAAAAVRPCVYGLVDRGQLRGTDLVQGELGHDRTLDAVVVCRARVEGLMRLLRGQGGVRVRPGEQQDALAQDRVRDAQGAAGTAGSDDADDRRIGREGRGGRLATLRPCRGRLDRQIDVVAEQRAWRGVERAVHAIDGELDPVHLVLPQGR